jgi:ribosomal-protein-alanine N-acetyltransferase
MSSFSIREAASLPQLHKDAYQLFCSHRHNPWQYSTFNKALLMPNSVIALIDRQLVGYVLVSEVLGEVEIEDICVSPMFRKKGVASQMFTHVVEDCKKHYADYILLEVASRNIAALRLYEKMGFEFISVRKDYYTLANEQLDDAILMRKGLKSSL